MLAAVLAIAYLLGVVRLRRQRRRWPLWRTVCFLLGCLVLAATTGLGVEAYGYALLSVFMFQQLTLMMTVPRCSSSDPREPCSFVRHRTMGSVS